MRTAIILTNYNMPERADALVDYIKLALPFNEYEVFLVDNGSDLVSPAANTTIWLPKNRQTCGGWLAGWDQAREQDFDAYWFLITSAEIPFNQGDILRPMTDFLFSHPKAVIIHPALTEDSTTHWKHMKTKGGSRPRRTWMVDNIAALYRADWYNSIGGFDAMLSYGWGVDLEMCYLARKEGRSIWIDERVQVEKITNIGYTMERMNMTASERANAAGANMQTVMGMKYGPQWWDTVTQEFRNGC